MKRFGAGALTRGNAAVEMALLLPVLIVIVCGAVDFSRAFYAYVTVSSTAHEAARYAARFPAGQVSASALQTRVAAESQGFVQIGQANGGNASLVGPSIEGIDEQVVRVSLTYQFSPISPIPLAGPIPIGASASAPTGGAGGVPTSTPVASPTITPSPTVTRTPTATSSPTAIAMCTVPDYVGQGVSLNGNTARDMWTAAGFVTGNFTKDENNGVTRRQTLPGNSQAPCASASITLHNHNP